jgi:hypothetical protein
MESNRHAEAYRQSQRTIDEQVTGLQREWPLSKPRYRWSKPVVEPLKISGKTDVRYRVYHRNFEVVHADAALILITTGLLSLSANSRFHRAALAEWMISTVLTPSLAEHDSRTPPSFNVCAARVLKLIIQLVAIRVSTCARIVGKRASMGVKFHPYRLPQERTIDGQKRKVITRFIDRA